MVNNSLNITFYNADSYSNIITYSCDRLTEYSLNLISTSLMFLIMYLILSIFIPQLQKANRIIIAVVSLLLALALLVTTENYLYLFVIFIDVLYIIISVPKLILAQKSK